MWTRLHPARSAWYEIQSRCLKTAACKAVILAVEPGDQGPNGRVCNSESFWIELERNGGATIRSQIRASPAAAVTISYMVAVRGQQFPDSVEQ